jgi:hypothetical protein
MSLLVNEILFLPSLGGGGAYILSDALMPGFQGLNFSENKG